MEQPLEPSDELKKWVEGTLNTIVEGLIKCLEAKSKGLIKQKKVVDKFLKEFNEHQNDTMDAFMFTIKAEFQPFYIDVIDKITKVAADQYEKALKKATESQK